MTKRLRTDPQKHALDEVREEERYPKLDGSIAGLSPAEKTIRDREALLRSIFRAAPVGIGLVLERKFRWINETLCELTGYRPEELIDKNTRILYASDEEYKFVGEEKYDQIERFGAGSVETQWLHKDGGLIDVWLSSSPLDPEDLSQGVTISVLEITAQKQAQEGMRRLRSLLRDIVNSMPSLLVGVDSEGKVTQWNQEAERVCGYRQSQVLGKPLSSVCPVFPVEMEKIRRAVEEKQPQVDVKVPWTVGDEQRYADITIYPLVSEGFGGAVIRIDDVTERVRMQQLMVQSEKMMSVGGLAAGMAHEINNPLAAILQSVQVIIERIGFDLENNRTTAKECGVTLEGVRQYLEERKVIRLLDGIKTSGLRAARIVDKMSSFSRKSRKQFSSYSLTELIEETLELAENDYDLKRNCDMRKIRIERDFEQDVPPVVCEKTEIQHVVLNLVKNAVYEMTSVKQPIAEPLLVLRVRKDEDLVRIEVEDNGPGMDETLRKRVFEPFFSTKDVGEGVGLGLSVSYFIVVEKHGGSLSVEPAVNGGSKFVVLLPQERNL